MHVLIHVPYEDRLFARIRGALRAADVPSSSTSELVDEDGFAPLVLASLFKAHAELPGVTIDGYSIAIVSADTKTAALFEAMDYPGVIPVLAVCLGDASARVDALEQYANYCLASDWSDQELVIALHQTSRTHKERHKRRLEIGSIVIDLYLHQIYKSADPSQPLMLTRQEFVILDMLCRRPRVVHSRYHILDHLHAANGFAGARSVDHVVKRLRRKLEDRFGFDGDALLSTAHGSGYFLNTNAII